MRLPILEDVAYAYGTLSGTALTVVSARNLILTRTGTGAFTATLPTEQPLTTGQAVVDVKCDLIGYPASCAGSQAGLAWPVIVYSGTTATDPTYIQIVVRRVPPAATM